MSDNTNEPTKNVLQVVAEFVAQREEYVNVLKQCIEADADYHRWQGHAEARRQLRDKLAAMEAHPAEPTPEQVEAAAAPAEYVAIEALVVEVARRVWEATDRPGGKVRPLLREFAADVLEVGGQQPGVPVEKVRALRDRFDWSAKQAIPDECRDYGRGARDTCIQAVRALSALLPKEPTS